MNILLNEERAIVSEIAGTTRDIIEDELILEGIKFRFIDTAGLRDTSDTIEKIGVARTRENIQKASLVLFLYDVNEDEEARKATLNELQLVQEANVPCLILANKIDIASNKPQMLIENSISISAASNTGIDELKGELLKTIEKGEFKRTDTLVTNARHYESLLHTQDSLGKAIEGLNSGVSGDFLAMDIRQSLHHLGMIVGEISTDDLLENIFSRFCIGK